MIVSSISLAFVLLSHGALVGAVTMEECKSEYLPNLLTCLEDTDGPCDYLPIPESAMIQNMPGENGYWLEHLRDTPTSHMFAIADGTYNSMIVVDVPPSTEVGKRHLAKPPKHGSLRGLDEEELLGDVGMPTEVSEDAPGRQGSGGITFGLIDFPENFYRRGADGAVVGYGVIDAMEEILGMLNATLEDVDNVEMVYSHGHFDHIGAANYTYNALIGLGFEDVPILASAGTLHFLEELIEAGVSSYRAPLPTVTFDSMESYTFGLSTKITLEPVNGHQHDSRDVIIFAQKQDHQPAIMFMVDVIFPKWVPFYAFGVTTDLLAYILLHDKMLMDYDLGDDGYFLGGHITQTGDRRDIELNKNLTMSVVANAGRALGTVNAGALIVGTGAFDPNSTNFGNQWLGVKAFTDGVHKECARLTIEEWGCTFAALDVYAESLCTVAQFYVRVDT